MEKCTEYESGGSERGGYREFREERLQKSTFASFLSRRLVFETVYGHCRGAMLGRRRASPSTSDTLKLSNVSILFLTLCVPVTAGMFAIFVADMFIVRHMLRETRQMYQQNGGQAGPPAD